MNPLERISDLVGRALGIISEAVTDKDKQAELRAHVIELQTAATVAIVQTPTVPWVDAVVKLLYALVALAAPIGTACMTAFGLYAHVKGIDIPVELHAALDLSFPGWRVARHREKMAGAAAPLPAPVPRRSGRP